MFNKMMFRRELIKVLKNRYTNWEEKSFYIANLIMKESYGEEVFFQIVKKEKNSMIRKAAASVVGYLNIKFFAENLIEQILLEKDWSVRFALAHSCGRVLGEKALSNLESVYKILLQSNASIESEYSLKIAYAEGLGAMGFVNALPILTSMLDSELEKHELNSNELILQILYSLGEIGDKSTINKLHKYLMTNQLNEKNTQQSAKHALDKIAKRYGYNSYSQILTEK